MKKGESETDEEKVRGGSKEGIEKEKGDKSEERGKRVTDEESESEGQNQAQTIEMGCDKRLGNHKSEKRILLYFSCCCC